MFEAKFKLKHAGCWTTGLTKFKSEFVTHNTLSLNEKFVQDITEVSLFDKKEANQIKDYFKHNKLVKKWDILQESNKKLLIQIFTDTSEIKSVVHAVLKNNCFLFNKVPLVNGSEVWTIAAPRKTAIKHALEEIEKLGEFKLLHIKKSSFDGFNLSDNQEKILKLAIQTGFYSWPKRTSIQDLAKNIGLSKPTVAEHLRKAEIKIILREFGK
ncbi:MAG: helix-turn-helix domain-containing protein [archaeon]